jgi:hypothetical protein
MDRVLKGLKRYGSKASDEAVEVGSKVWLSGKEIEVVSSLPLSRLQGGIIDLSDNEEENKKSEPSSTSKFQQYVAPTVVKQVARQEALAPKVKPIGPLYVIHQLFFSH